MSRKIRPTVRFERLEDRQLLSTLELSASTGGVLTYDATTPTPGATALTISSDGTTYTFDDPAQTITLGANATAAGWAVSNKGHDATGPVSSVTSLVIDAAGDPASPYINSVNLQSISNSATVNLPAGTTNTMTVSALGVPAADTVSVSGPPLGSSLNLNIDAGSTPGTFATGPTNVISYQASGFGTISTTNVAGTLGVGLVNPLAAGLTVDLNDGSLFPSPASMNASVGSDGAGNTVFGAGADNYTFPTADLAAVNVGGTTDGTNLVVNYTNGDPLPASGLNYDPPLATSGSNDLVLVDTALGGGFSTENYTATGAGAGTIAYTMSTNPAKTITFSNLTPITDTVPAPTFTFTSPTSNQTVDLVNGPLTLGGQSAEINSGGTGNFELIDFANKAAVTVLTPGTGNTVNVNYTTAAAGMTSLAVNGAGTDTATTDISATPSSVPTTVTTSGGGTTNIGASAVNPSGALSSVQGNVSVSDSTGAGTLNITDGSATNQNYTIGGTSVTTSATPATLTYASSITTLAVTGGTGTNVFNVPNESSLVPTDTYNFNGGAGDTSTLNITTTSPTVTFSTPGVLDFGAGNAVINYSNFAHINITKPTASPVGAAVTLSAVENQAFNNQVVATFTSPDLAPASDFVASINWGDSTASTGGVIVANGTTGFDILGSHTYANPGPYTVDVSLTALGNVGSTSTVVGTTIITLITSGQSNSTPDPIPSSVNVSAAPLAAAGVPVSGTEGVALNPATGGDVLVATFTDAGTVQAATGYTASIAWGDGGTSADTRIVATGTADGTVFSVYGNHTYANVGSYPVVVTITKTSTGAVAIGSSTATIAPAAITETTPAPTVSTTENTSFSGPVVTFTDANPNATASSFRALIDWGDGSPSSVGVVSLSSGVFTVTGTHDYISSLPNGAPGTGQPGPQDGTFPISVYVTSTSGATASLTNTADVKDNPVSLAGQVDPASISSVVPSQMVTDIAQPTFTGLTSEPYAQIQLSFVSTAGGTPAYFALGQANLAGAWAVTSPNPFANGSYDIYAQAVDPAGQTRSAVTMIASITIDTQGPRITDLSFNRVKGQLTFAVQDFGAAGNNGVGVDLASMEDANNYLLTKANVHLRGAYRVSSITVSPASSTGAQMVTLTFNHGHYLPGGRYYFTVKSKSPSNVTGVQDNAGNALDGEFYNYFPSGNGVNGGDFQAEIDSVHHRVFPPLTLVGSATPLNPPGTPGHGSLLPTYNGKTGKPQARFAAVNAAAPSAVAMGILDAAIEGLSSARHKKHS